METEQLNKIVDGCMNKVINYFIKHPYNFYTEQAIHCYLYHVLFERKELIKSCSMANGMKTILFHKEYPTTRLYKRENGVLRDKNEKERGARGRFDVVVFNQLNAKNIDSTNFRYRKKPIVPAVAIELALNEGTFHLKNDYKKLVDAQKDGTRGHLLHFIRNQPLKGKKFQNFETTIHEINRRNKVREFGERPKIFGFYIKI
jgi:hypothetical protein